MSASDCLASFTTAAALAHPRRQLWLSDLHDCLVRADASILPGFECLRYSTTACRYRLICLPDLL